MLRNAHGRRFPAPRRRPIEAEARERRRDQVRPRPAGPKKIDRSLTAAVDCAHDRYQDAHEMHQALVTAGGQGLTMLPGSTCLAAVA